MNATLSYSKSSFSFFKPALNKLLIVFSFAACLLAIAPPSIADTVPRGSDPLSAAEINLVRSAVAVPGATASTGARSSAEESVSDSGSDPVLSNDNAPVLLLIERRLPESKTAEDERLADVYWYDYSDDALLHSIVAVETGEIRRQEVLRNTQLPLVESEIQRAANIVMSHPETRERLEEAFESITGRQLRDITDIDFKAFVFHAKTLPAERAPASAMCGFHRCARMVMYTKDNISLGFSPIIDLSENRAIQLPAR